MKKEITLIAMALLGGLLTWSFYELIRKAIGRGLEQFFGVSDPITQAGIVVIVIFTGFLIVAFFSKKIGVWDVIMDLIK